MIAAARQAGAILMRHFHGAGRQELKVSLKGPADWVSTADLESEGALRAALLGAHPGHGFVGEEREASPLRGLHRLRAKRTARRLDPSKDEMFTAEARQGARLGEQPLRVSDEAGLGTALIGTGIPHGNRPERHARYLVALARVMKESGGMRRFSAAALDLAYVAAGRLDALFEEGLSPWDVAAGALPVREARGSRDRSGGRRRRRGLARHPRDQRPHPRADAGAAARDLAFRATRGRSSKPKWERACPSREVTRSC